MKKPKRTKEEWVDYYKDYRQEMKSISLEIGNCTKCWKPKDSLGKLCLRCLYKNREYARKHYKNV